MDNPLVRLVAALAIFLLPLVALLIGRRLGLRRLRALGEESKVETAPAVGAMLGILGLLLGFSFAGASSRFGERQDLINREANTIGTAHLRADLLDPPHADELKAALREYVDHRVRLSRELRTAVRPEDLLAVEEAHQRIWGAACAGVRAKPTATVVIVPVVNEVIDLHSARIAASRKHLPGLVLALLGTCSVLTLGVMGYSSAFGHQRNNLLMAATAVLVGSLLWTTVDLDLPRIGLIRVSDAALVGLQRSLEASSRPR